METDSSAIRAGKKWDAELNETASQSLEPDAEKVKQSPERIRQLLAREGLTDVQKSSGRFNLALALFHGGDFKSALAELNAISSESSEADLKSLFNQINLYKAACHSALGNREGAVKLADDVRANLEMIPKTERSGVLLELGKIFNSAENDSKAEACWSAGADLVRDDEEQVGNYNP